MNFPSMRQIAMVLIVLVLDRLVGLSAKVANTVSSAVPNTFPIVK